MSVALSLRQLEEFDPKAPARSGERRFCCPLCNADRELNAAHRSLSVDVRSGAWLCHRCRAAGLLAEYQTHGARRSLLRSRARLSLSGPGRPAPSTKVALSPPYNFQTELRRVRPLAGTLAQSYLRFRGLELPENIPDVGFSPTFLGTPAVVFTLRGPDGEVSGLHGRICEAQSVWKRTIKRSPLEPPGVFLAAGLDDEPLAITEAPIDALTLSLAGLPCVATVGTSCPQWLADRLALRQVLLAHDRDEPGDKAACAIAGDLLNVGARPARLRPPVGFKDWNECLRALGADTFEAVIGRVRASLRPAPADLGISPSEIGSGDYDHRSLREKYRVCSAVEHPSVAEAAARLAALLLQERLAERQGPNALSDHLFRHADEYERLRLRIEAAMRKDPAPQAGNRRGGGHV